MRKYLLIMLLLITYSPINAQDSSDVKYGLGITIVDIKDIANTFYSYHTFSPTFSIPIIINDKIKIEPSFGYYNRNIDFKPKNNSNSNNRYKVSDSNMHLGLGLFLVSRFDDLLVYYGSHFIYIISTEEQKDSSSKDTEEGNGFSIAPSIGAEYFFSNHFSIGGELQFKYLKLTREEKSTNSTADLDKITYDSFVTRTMLVVRFYL